MRLTIFIFLLGLSQWGLAHNYRLNCDQYVSNALCQAINNYLAKFDPTKVALKDLAIELQTRFISLQKVSLTKNWDGKIDVQVNSVQPVYIIDFKNSDRVFVLTKSEPDARIVPALWFNPVCLENLSAVCLNSKILKTDISKNSLQKNNCNKTRSKINQPGYGVISQHDLNLINQIPGKFKDFLLALDPKISTNYLIEWIDQNQIILHYCKLAGSYSCKILVRVHNLEQQVLTSEFLARCLKLLPAELFIENGVIKNGAESTLGNSKTSKNRLKNFTIDLRFNKQVVILND